MALVDAKDRRISYLRVSLTDRCGYGCTYCLPAAGFVRARRDALLTLEEIVRVVRVFRDLGVDAVRLTGGEPTARRGLVGLVQRLSGLPGLRHLALTTNGERLATLAAPLAEAGLGGVNVSLDSLDPARFARLTGGGRLDRVLAGIEAAREAGLAPVKLNTVLIRGENDHEVEDLVRFAWDRDLVPRFVELMPIGEAGQGLGPGSVVPTREVLARLAPLLAPAGAPAVPGRGPAFYRAARADAARAVGFVGAVTERFCADCNRVRLTPTGELRGCLARPEGADLRGLLRRGADDATLAEVIRETVLGRREGHDFEAGGASSARAVVMTGIGG